MADIQDTDLFLVNRNSTSYQVPSSDLMAELQDDDLMLVNRGGTSYKATGAEIKDSLGPKGTVDTPSIIAPADNAGEVVSAESDEILDRAISPIDTWTGMLNTWTGTGTTSSPTGGTTGVIPVQLPKTGLVVWEVELTTYEVTRQLGIYFSNTPSGSYDDSTSTLYFNGGSGTCVLLTKNSDGSLAAGPGGKHGGEVVQISDPSTHTLGVAFKVGDIIGFVFNADLGAMWVSRNGEYVIEKTKLQANPSAVPDPFTGAWALWSGIDTTQDLYFGSGLSSNFQVENRTSSTYAPTSTVLTLAGDKDLTVFKALDDVQQDSGYTPTTSAITNISTVADNSTGMALVAYQFANDTTTYDATGATFNLGSNYTSSGTTGFVWKPGTVTSLNVTPNSGGADMQIYTSPDGNSWTRVLQNVTGAQDLSSYKASWIACSLGDGSAATAVWDAFELTILTLTDDTDLANFRVDDTVSQIPTSGFLFSASSSLPIYTNAGNTIMIFNYPSAGGTLEAFDMNFYVNTAGIFSLSLKAEGGNIPFVASGDFISGSVTGTIAQAPGVTNLAYTFQSPGLLKFRIAAAPEGATRNDINTYFSTFSGSIPGFLIDGTPILFSEYKEEAFGNITAIDSSNNKIFVNRNSLSTFVTGQPVIGPATTPATGTIGSIDVAAKTMTLSASDEAYPKRWIVNQGKFVIGEETPSMDAAPDADGLTIQSSAFASTPDGSLGHTTSDWQVTLKDDIAYTNVIDSATDSTDLTTWEPTGLAEDTAYRCRVRHSSNAIKSEWSEDSTFKTAVDLGPEVSAHPGALNIYNVQSASTKFTSPVKFVNWACGTFLVGVGEDGQIYKGPAPADTSGSFALSSINLPAGELALDVYVSYQADPESTAGTTVVLCKSGKAYIHGNATPVATDVKRIIKLGGVTRICILEKNDGTYLGVNTHASSTYNVGTDAIAPNTVAVVTITMPADDNVIISLSGLYGSYDAASSIICTEKGNLYLIAKDGTNLSEVGLPVGVKSNAAPYLITEAGWSALQGNASAAGSFSNCFATSGGMWIRTNTDELYAVSFALLNGWDGIATSAGPVKVLDNALSGAISIYGADHWFAIGKDGFAYDATKSRTLTKNTVAGAIFGPQGTGHASFNGSNSNVYCIIDN
jgi:hypothetical protein